MPSGFPSGTLRTPNARPSVRRRWPRFPLTVSQRACYTGHSMLCTGDETTTREGPPRRRGGPFTAPTDGVPILIVDDDANFCAAVSRALASVPFLPFSVRGGVDALRFLARAAPFEDAPRPAFVVLDFNLPDLNAPAVLADMRAHPLH